MARATWLLLFVLGAAACGKPPAAKSAQSDGKKPDVVVADPSAEPDDSGAVPTSAETDDTRVKLLDPGAEPRSVLRLKLTPGTSETMSMSIRMRIETAIGGRPAPKVPLPEMQELLDMKVVKKQADGSARVEFVVKNARALPSPDVPDAVVSAVGSALAGLSGMHGYIVITDRGVVTSGTVDMPESASPEVKKLGDQLRESLSEFASPVPKEPVGIGAKWVVTTHPHANGIKLTQQATQTLVERAGNRVKTRAVVESTAEPQVMQIDKLPPGASAKLESLVSHGEGGSTWTVDHLVPTAAAARSSTKLRATMSIESQTMPLITESVIELTLGPK